MDTDARYVPPPGYRLCGLGCGVYTYKFGAQDERHRSPEDCRRTARLLEGRR